MAGPWPKMTRNNDQEDARRGLTATRAEVLARLGRVSLRGATTAFVNGAHGQRIQTFAGGVNASGSECCRRNASDERLQQRARSCRPRRRAQRLGMAGRMLSESGGSGKACRSVGTSAVCAVSLRCTSCNHLRRHFDGSIPCLFTLRTPPFASRSVGYKETSSATAGR